MKHRALKISLLSLGGLLVVLIGAIAVAIWYVFTPEKLTPIAREQAAKYLTCRTEIGQVDLTFFSTFPEFGLRLTDVVLTATPDSTATAEADAATCAGDTIAAIRSCVAIIDPMAYLKENAVVIKKFLLSDTQANVYFRADGSSNLDIVATTEETTTEEDTTATSFSLDRVSLADINIEHLNLHFRDDQSGLNCHLHDATLGLSFEGTLGDNLNPVQLSSDGITLQLHEAAYADSLYDVSLYELAARLTPVRLDHDNLSLGLEVSLDSVRFVQPGDTPLTASLQEVRLSIPQLTHDTAWNVQAQLSLGDVQVAGGKDLYVDHQPVSLQLAARANEALSLIDVQPSALTYAGHTIDFTAQVDMPDSLTTRVGATFGLQQTELADLWALVPEFVTKQLDRMQFAGTLDLNGSAAITMEGDALAIDSFRVASHIEGVEVEMGKSLKVTASKNEVLTSYPAAGRPSDILTDLTAENIRCIIQDSSTIDADLNALTFSGYISDKILSGSSDIPAVDAKWTLTKLAAAIDDMEAKAQTLSGSVKLPASKATAAIPPLTTTVNAAELAFRMDTVQLLADGIHATVGVTAQRGGHSRFSVQYQGDQLSAHMGEALKFETQSLSMKAEVTDEILASAPTDDELNDLNALGKLLLKYDPALNVDLKGAVLTSSDIKLPIEIPSIDFQLNLGKCLINKSNLKVGNSDFALEGQVTNLREYLLDKDLLTGNLKFTSDYTDVYQLMDLVDGLGATDSTTVASATTDATAPASADSTTTEGDPFIVPKGVDFTLDTRINHAMVGENDFSNLGGSVTVRDGVLVLEEMGFSSKAARMQLTAMYKSEMRNHLFVGANFHLLDIEIADLLKLIPDIDTIVPMLSAFDGKAEFHLAAETNLTSNYDIKMSTLKATAAIEGKDLVVLDNETFSTIAKYLMFNKKTENKIDSISVEMAVARRKATLYPFLISMDKYQAVVAGTHNLSGNMSCNYNVSITDWPLPGIHPGVDISGDMTDLDNLSFKLLANGKYANLYRPEKRNATQSQVLELKQLISQSLKRTVKETNTVTPVYNQEGGL
jgi:hypothetical protein